MIKKGEAMDSPFCSHSPGLSAMRTRTAVIHMSAVTESYKPLVFNSYLIHIIHNFYELSFQYFFTGLNTIGGINCISLTFLCIEYVPVSGRRQTVDKCLSKEIGLLPVGTFREEQIHNIPRCRCSC